MGRSATPRSFQVAAALLVRAGLCAFAATLASCHKESPAAQAPAPEPPPGEVWLTPAQVAGVSIGVATIDVREVDDTIATSGTVALDDVRSGHVMSPVTGRVVRIIAALGEHVKKGQPLAAIESPDVGDAVSDVHKAEADLVAAQHAYERKKTLFEQKAGPASDVEVAEDAFRRAKAEIERARAKQALLRVGSADSVSQTYLLASPIEGDILMTNAHPGIEVQGQYSGGSSVELFTIGDVSRVWVLADVYEMDLARVHPGVPATVRVAAYPARTFDGRVDWVSGSIDPTTRAARVRCTFDNPERLLLPQMYATVNLSVDRKQALAIPRDALLRLGDAKAVFVRVGESADQVRFRRSDVDVDEGESSPWLEVRGGLQPGQAVVTRGAILLSEML
jgi:cobalt-zinc-cadmium efflux system membrane fusion protein